MTAPWEGTVDGFGFILEHKTDPADGFSIMTLGLHPRIWMFTPPDRLSYFIPDGDGLKEAATSELTFLFRHVFHLDAVDGNYPWELVKEDPKRVEFLEAYQRFKKATDAALAKDGVIDEKGSAVYIKRLGRYLGRMKRKP